MDEQRLERALRQGPPFATRYVPSSLALDEQLVVRGPVSVGRLVLIIAVTALLLVGMLAGLAALGAFRTEEPSVDLGIFEPVAGRIVYGDQQGIWGVSPAAPTYPPMSVQLTSRAGTPLGWSSDGTRLLIMRQSRGEEHLFVLHVDGSETQVTEQPMSINGAAISPDGTRVVFASNSSAFAGDSAVYAVDANGGPAEVLVESQIGSVEEPTFSPDGTQIAFTDGAGDHSHSVWVMDANGTDVHQIVANESTTGAGHVYGLAWSPIGDRIAVGIEGAIYTFAIDGSDFTRVIPHGDLPYWSPDGSRIAYTESCFQVPLACGFGIADADGSNPVRFGVGSGTSGPWHPGTLENSAGG